MEYPIRLIRNYTIKIQNASYLTYDSGCDVTHDQCDVTLTTGTTYMVSAITSHVVTLYSVPDNIKITSRILQHQYCQGDCLQYFMGNLTTLCNHKRTGETPLTAWTINAYGILKYIRICISFTNCIETYEIVTLPDCPNTTRSLLFGL